MSNLEETKIMSDAEQVADLERYMANGKKNLKTMSKNDLIKSVLVLLIDKQMLQNQLQRLMSANSSKEQKDSSDAQTT